TCPKSGLRNPQAQAPRIGDDSDTLCACDTPPVGSDNRPTGDGARGACRSAIRADQGDTASRRKVDLTGRV
ncbi:MAG: hypothetical protein RRC34_07475, partial [Lentisphaeria bacterium]|nr:hypothetical protein [Lentisphaeria bacterium]